MHLRNLRTAPALRGLYVLRARLFEDDDEDHEEEDDSLFQSRITPEFGVVIQEYSHPPAAMGGLS